MFMSFVLDHVPLFSSKISADFSEPLDPCNEYLAPRQQNRHEEVRWLNS